LHYPRIPREYWEHRIKLSKAMGMNTICIYLFWNLHEQQPGQYDFKGQNNVAEFVKLAQKNGMYCIVRPVCVCRVGHGQLALVAPEETGRAGAHPERSVFHGPDQNVPEAAKQLAPLQIQNGGNILMVQVENEYATFGDEQAYMEATRNAVREAGFDKAQLFRCDWPSNFNKYQLEGVATTLNFAAGTNINESFKTFQKLNPTAPLMCSEQRILVRVV